MEEGKNFKRDYINNLMQTYFPEISSLEDSTQTVIQTIFEWSLSNFEKRLKLYCSAAPRHDEEELRRLMQTSDVQENYLMQIFKGRQINGTGAVHTQYTNSAPRSQPVQPANLPPNHVLQPHANGPMIGRHQGHTHVMPALNHANQLINVVPVEEGVAVLKAHQAKEAAATIRKE